MIQTQLNYLDITVVSIIIISMLVSLFRGFVSELLSLAAWIGATVVTLLAMKPVGDRLQEKYGLSEVVAGGAGALGTFLAAIIVFSILNKIMGKFLKSGTDVGSLDKIFGLAFGFVRGGFLVSLGFLLLTMVFDKDHYPDWIKEAKSLPAVEWGADKLAALAPEDMKKLREMGKDAQEAATQAIDNASGSSREAGTDAKNEAKGELHDLGDETIKEGQGYTKQTVNELQRVIDQSKQH